MRLPKNALSDQTVDSLSGDIKTATTFRQSLVIDAIVSAFSADPVARWTWPDRQDYLTHFPIFVKIFGGKTFAKGSAYYVESYAGDALWLSSDAEPDEHELINLFQSTVSEQIQKDLFSVFEAMEGYHPNEAHWYLPLIGVSPSWQGRGYGSALMKHALNICDLDQILAYLEATSVRSIPFYERHGFEVIGTIQVGTSPPLFPMLRKSQ